MWEGVGDWTETAKYWPPQPLWTLPCLVFVLLGCSTGGPGGGQLSAECWLSLPHLVINGSGLQNSLGVPRALSAGWCLSLPHLVSNSSDLQLTVFTQSLEWYVWSSSSGNNCHAVHRSLSSGASVYECTMGFYLVPYCQPSPPTWFLLITAVGMCHFLPVNHFGTACLAGSKVNIQHYHDITDHSRYLPQLWSCDIHAAN